MKQTLALSWSFLSRAPSFSYSLILICCTHRRRRRTYTLIIFPLSVRYAIIPLKTYFRITANVLIMGLISLLQLLRYKTDVAKVSFRKKKTRFTINVAAQTFSHSCEENATEDGAPVREEKKLITFREQIVISNTTMVDPAVAQINCQSPLAE